MNDLVQRLRAWHTPGETITGDVQLYLDAADRIETMETMLQCMADGRIVMLARIEALEADFNSAAAAASEYSEFWEQHHGDFDQFGNYVPYSQMDGDLRAAKARIEALEKALAGCRELRDYVVADCHRLRALVELEKDRIEALETALREIMTNKDEDHWEVNRIARAALAPEQDK